MTVLPPPPLVLMTSGGLPRLHRSTQNDHSGARRSATFVMRLPVITAVRARFHHGQHSPAVIAVGITGLLGMAASGHIQLTVVRRRRYLVEAAPVARLVPRSPEHGCRI